MGLFILDINSNSPSQKDQYYNIHTAYCNTIPAFYTLLHSTPAIQQYCTVLQQYCTGQWGGPGAPLVSSCTCIS